MARYIDADALKDKWLEEMMRWSKQSDDYCDGSHWTDVYADFIKELLEFPTADAVPVVRCKHCQFYEGHFRRCSNDMVAFREGYCWLGDEEKEEDYADSNKRETI